MIFSRSPNQLLISVNDRDHCRGDSAAKITLVEYGDYQCSCCQSAHVIIQSLQQQLGDRFRFVFRHFPQSQIHPNAYHAAEAVEAAASQNKFWAMHHHLLTHPSQLADSDLVKYAIALYLDIDRFLQEMSSDCHMARVQADIESGMQSGVTRTPTFFIHGLKCSDDLSLAGLRESVVQASYD
jgi:protein-disulfide isomerase